MNHILNLALGRAAAIVLLWFTSFSGVAAEPDKISLAYCTDCVPFHFQDKDGRPAGMIIDFWRLWSERTRIEIDFRTAPWDGTLRMVAEGRADAHAGLFFSDARARFLEYGVPLTKTDTHFFVKKGLPPIETVEELAGHRVGVLAGDFVEEFLKKRLPAEDVIGFENYDGIMTALREGKLQIFAADTPTGIFHLQNSGLGFAYEFPADRPLYRNDWLVAARKGNTDLIRVIDAGMALITETERREIEQRWVALGTKGFALTTQDIIALVAFLGFAIAVGVLIWNRTLRRRIELRTGELETELGQRRRAEEALRESQQLFQTVLDHMPAPVYLRDVDGRFMLINRRYEEIHQVTRDDVRGKTLHEVFSKERADDYGTLDAEVIKQRRVQEGEETHQHSDGEQTLAVVKFPIFDPSDDVVAVGGVDIDITERKRVEEALRESEERYALAIQGSNEGLSDWDVARDILRVSPRFKAISGLTTDSLEITPAQWLARMHPDDVERYRDDMRVHLRGGTDFFSGEFRLLGEQGHDCWIRASARGLRDETGHVSRMVGSIGDITERKQAEEEVRKVWDAIEELSEGFALYDSNDRLVKCNQRYREIFSSIADMLVPGTSFEEILDAAVAGNIFSNEEHREAWKRARIEEHHQPSADGLLQRSHDGRWILVKEHRTADGGYLSIRTDVTELKRAEEALSDQLKFTEALVDTIPNLIFVKGPEGRYLNFNRAYEKAFGARREDDIGKTVMELEYVPLDIRKRLDRETHELLRTGGTAHAETVRELSDGKEHDLLYWQSAFELSSGVIGGLVGVFVDISEQKSMERELAAARDAAETARVALEEAYEVIKDRSERMQALADYMQVALSSMSDGIYILDGDLNIVAFNQRYVDILNFPEGLVREGGSIVDVTKFAAKRGDYGSQFDGDIDDVVAGRLKQFKSNEEYLIENITPTGRIVEYRGSPIKGGGFVAIMHDITERKQAAEALEEAYKVIKDRSDRMEDELSIAREIQMSMVPLIFPPFPIHDEFSLFATLEPAREVGGDFYDFYFIDEDRLCLCIGDVSGKGVPSALFMAVAKTLIKSRAGDDRSTASILTHVNDELSRDNKSHMFVTIFAAILNIATGELVYTNAGHNPPYLKRADGTLQRLDRRHGPVVAAVEGMVYKEDRDRMAPGDLLMLYTDGVTEARGPEDRMFSEDRLRDLLASMTACGVEAAVAETVATVRAFEQGTEQADDITVLALEFHGSPHDAPIAERRIVIKNRLPDIAVANATFDAFAEEFGIPVPIATKFNLVFDELLSNIITYAYRNDAEHEIEINIERAKNRLTVTIADDGVPFNPLGAEIPDTTLSLADRDTGGLGIHLVRNLVDELSYQRRIDRNVVTMTSQLDAEGGGSRKAHRKPSERIE